MTDLKEFQRFEQSPFVRKETSSEHVSFSDKGPLLETLEFFEICHGSYKPFNFLAYSSVYAVFYSNAIGRPFHMIFQFHTF